MLALDTEESVKFSAVKAFVRRRVIRREVCRCATCNARVHAPLPPMPWKNSSFDPSFVAWVVYMKFVLFVPLDRIHKALLRQNANISWSALVYLIERAADLLGPIDGVHMKQLKEGGVIGLDGTSIAVVVEGLDTTWKGFLEIFCRDHLHVYPYTPTKIGRAHV